MIKYKIYFFYNIKKTFYYFFTHSLSDIRIVSLLCEKQYIIIQKRNNIIQIT